MVYRFVTTKYYYYKDQFATLFHSFVKFQDVKKMEKFVNNLMRHMASNESN